MSWAVHGLKGELLLLHLKREHVLTVVLPVAGGHPEPAIEDVWSDNLLESSFPIFTLFQQNTHTGKSVLTLVEGEESQSNLTLLNEVTGTYIMTQKLRL